MAVISTSGRVQLSGRGRGRRITQGALGPDTNVQVPRETNITIQTYAPAIEVGVAPVVITEVTNIGAYDSSITSGMPTGYNRQATWNSVSIGTAAADRIVVVALGTRDANSPYPALVTIGGQTATVVDAYRSSKAHSILAWAHIPTGTTADIVVTFPGFPPSGSTWGTVYTVTGAVTSATESSDSENGTALTLTASVGVSDGSGVIACSYYEDLGNTTSPTCAWTGLTEDYDVTETTNGFSSASGVMNADDATYSVTPTWTSASGNQDMSLAVIVFEPANPGSSSPGSGPVPVNTVEEGLLERADIYSIFQYRTSTTHPGTENFTSGLDDGRITLIEDPDDSSVATMRCLFLEGTRGHIQFIVDLLGIWDDVTFTFTFRQASADGSAVVWQRGGKYPGLGGGTLPNGGGGTGADGLGFSARYNWVETSTLSGIPNISLYPYDMYADATHLKLSTVDPTRLRSETNASPSSANFVLEDDTWYKITQRLEANTPGSADGRYRTYINDVLAHDVQDAQFRVSGYGIDCVFFSTFYGGSNIPEYQAAKDTWIYYKDISVTINDTGETFTFDLEGPTATASPAISGSFVDGQTLTMSQGTWVGTGSITYAYQWRRNGAPILGATSNTYTLTSSDVGTTVMCTITATDDEGSRYFHDYGDFVASA